MLLSEMVRKIKDEQCIVEDKDIYANYINFDWTTFTTKQISLGQAAVVLVKFTAQLYNSSSNSQTAAGGVRVLLNDVPCIATGYLSASVPAGSALSYEYEQILYLPAGSHTFTFQISSVQSAAGVGVRLTNIYIGIINFPDLVVSVHSGSMSIPNGSTLALLSMNITLPQPRKTCAGIIKQIPVAVILTVDCDGYAGSKLKNPGEADEALLNWRIYLDGTPVSWSKRVNDYQTVNQAYCEGAYGHYVIATLVPGSSHTISLYCYNNSGATRTVRAYASIIMSPWLLWDIEHEPISLTFPQGSTLYLILEPLSQNQTKTIKLGKKRAASFGDATDYYSIASGTNILSWNYTFESVNVEDCTLLVRGHGGCISIIAVDVRA